MIHGQGGARAWSFFVLARAGCRGTVGFLSWSGSGDAPKIGAIDMEHHMPSETQAKPPVTPAEVGFLVKVYRDAMEWSQETLAELSGLTVRTIQRVEAGQPSSLDTRRAIARGFQIPDLDVFNKPNPFPTQQELDQQKAEFDRKYLVLDAGVVDGRKIAGCSAISRGTALSGLAARSSCPMQRRTSSPAFLIISATAWT